MTRVAAVLMVLGCAPESMVGPAPGQPAAALVDGRNTGNPHFFWLPPIASPESPNGTFDDTRSPEVVIFEDDVEIVRHAAQLSLVEEAYELEWATRDVGLDPAHEYRIAVELNGSELGSVGLKVVSRLDPWGGILARLAGDVAITIGRVLPIRFRLEHGALPLTWTLLTGIHPRNLGTVWASSPNDVWSANGYQAVAHFDGTSWSTVTGMPGANQYDVWGFAPNDVYIAGQWSVHRYDGTGWTSLLADGREYFGVWGPSPTAVFVCGDGNLLRWDGSSWTDLPTGLSTAFADDRLEDLWGTSATDVFVVGWKGRILHYDGTSVTQQLMAPGIAFHAVHGTGPTNVYAAGNNGAIWRYDGTSWSPMVSGSSEHFFGVYALAPDDVYVAGTNGTLLHYDGTSWTPIATSTTHLLYEVFAVSPDLIYVGVSPADLSGAILVGMR